MPYEGTDMITNITLENFKCFLKLEVNPRLITVFIGPNGTGKSSVLQALILMKQSIGSNGLNHSGGLLALARPEDIVNKSQGSEATVRIEFGGTDERPDRTQWDLGPSVEYRYGADFFGTNIAAAAEKIAFEFEDKPIDIEATTAGEFPNQIDVGNRVVILRKEEQVGRLVRLEGWAGGSPSFQLHAEFERIVDTPCSVLREIRFVPAIRGLMQASYRLGPDVNVDIVQAGGHGYLEQQTATNLGYSRRLEEKLSGLLKQVNGVGLRADIVPQQSVEPTMLTPVGEVNILLEGFGTNALISLFLQIISAEKGATIMMEEPEIHLHPRAQAEVASVLANEARAENKQIIMTTHSEHILGRLLTLVAEKKLSKDDLAIYSFEKDDQGACTASQIEVTDDGRVVGGLRDFFETDLAELDRFVRAMLPSE